MLSSYRNQSVDLQRKPTDWFLYDGNIGCSRVKTQERKRVNNEVEIVQD